MGGSRHSRARHGVLKWMQKDVKKCSAAGRRPISRPRQDSARLSFAEHKAHSTQQRSQYLGQGSQYSVRVSRHPFDTEVSLYWSASLSKKVTIRLHGLEANNTRCKCFQSINSSKRKSKQT